MNIFKHTDYMNDTLEVNTDESLRLGSIVAFDVDGHPWLTPEQSKQLRKALKAWERSVA